MKITRTPENLQEAEDILLFLNTGKGAPFQPVINVLDGVIWFTSGVIPLSDREAMVTDNVSRETFRDASTSEEVLSVIDRLAAHL